LVAESFEASDFGERLYTSGQRQSEYLQSLSDTFREEEKRLYRDQSFRAISHVFGHKVETKTHEYSNIGERLYAESLLNKEKLETFIEKKKEELREKEELSWECVICGGRNGGNFAYCQNMLDMKNVILRMKVQTAARRVARQLYKGGNGEEMCGLARQKEFVPFVSSKPPEMYDEKQMRYVHDSKLGVTVAKPLHEVLHVSVNEKREEMETEAIEKTPGFQS
jgi:hypothetical protein